jgi:hypothetical protein
MGGGDKCVQSVPKCSSLRCVSLVSANTDETWWGTLLEHYFGNKRTPKKDGEGRHKFQNSNINLHSYYGVLFILFYFCVLCMLRGRRHICYEWNWRLVSVLRHVYYVMSVILSCYCCCWQHVVREGERQQSSVSFYFYNIFCVLYRFHHSSPSCHFGVQKTDIYRTTSWICMNHYRIVVPFACIENSRAGQSNRRLPIRNGAFHWHAQYDTVLVFHILI